MTFAINPDSRCSDHSAPAGAFDHGAYGPGRSKLRCIVEPEQRANADASPIQVRHNKSAAGASSWRELVQYTHLGPGIAPERLQRRWLRECREPIVVVRRRVTAFDQL